MDARLTKVAVPAEVVVVLLVFLPQVGLPSVNSPQEKKGLGRWIYLFSWRSLDDSRLCCVAGDEEEVDFNFVGAVCWCVADVDVDVDDCC